MKTTIEMAREAWAKAGEGWVAQNWYLDREKAFKELEDLVRADEREACALVVENIERKGDWITKAEAAEAIRARGETK
jgi:hypothetical protein